MRRSPARLVIALSVAAALAVFVVYTAVAGAGTPQIQPSDLAGYHGKHVLLVGKVVRTTVMPTVQRACGSSSGTSMTIPVRESR